MDWFSICNEKRSGLHQKIFLWKSGVKDMPLKKMLFESVIVCIIR